MLDPKSVAEVLSDWFSKKRSTSVAFRDSFEPTNDPNESYVVTYEAVFEPSTLDQARVEVWITDQGYVAVGLETRERIAKRLGVTNRRKGFAVGHEPQQLIETDLLALLELIAYGRIALSARVWPIVGLGQIKALALSESLTLAKFTGYDPRRWINQVTRLESGELNKVLQFHPW